MPATTHVEYVNFKAGEAEREYCLRVRRGPDVHLFTVAIPNAAFLSGRVRYQDAPDICFLKIRRELADWEEGALPALEHSVTDGELEQYRVAHAPKRPGRRF